MCRIIAYPQDSNVLVILDAVSNGTSQTAGTALRTAFDRYADRRLRHNRAVIEYAAIAAHQGPHSLTSGHEERRNNAKERESGRR